MGNTGPDAVEIRVQRVSGPRRADLELDEAMAMKIKASTHERALGGLLASRVREGVRALSITGIGPGAVLKAMKAIALARAYVAELRADFASYPRFVTLLLSGDSRTGFTIDLVVEGLPGAM